MVREPVDAAGAGEPAGFVLDASVTVSWCFEDERTPATQAVLERLREVTAFVPAIWPLEVGNALLVAERRSRLGPEQTGAILDLLARLPIRFADPVTGPDWMALVVLARNAGLATYDAAYLDLALRSGLPLASTDARLRAAAETRGVQVLP